MENAEKLATQVTQDKKKTQSKNKKTQHNVRCTTLSASKDK
jgi:hypothetical protein